MAESVYQIWGVSFQGWQIIAICCIFCWGGFVRSGIGFGGATLTLPLLLLVHPDPFFFLPIIGIHLLIFGGINAVSEFHLVDWPYLRRLLSVITIPKLIGVFGLLQLPTHILLVIIYGVSFYFSIGYLFKRHQKKTSTIAEYGSLIIGGYASGTALSGAAAIVPVVARHVKKEQLRSTLFMLWVVLVMIKLFSFYLAGLSFQLEHQLWLLPAAAIGNHIGSRFHLWLRQLPDATFYTILGIILLLLSMLGLVKVDWIEVGQTLVFW